MGSNDKRNASSKPDLDRAVAPVEREQAAATTDEGEPRPQTTWSQPGRNWEDGTWGE